MGFDSNSILTFIVLFLISVFLIIKNENTSRNYEIIYRAIYEYERKYNKPGTGQVMRCYMREYIITLFVFWDWSYKNILPSKYYEKIKEFIDDK